MASQTVGTTAVEVALSSDTGETGQLVLLQNLGAGDLYFGTSDAVTSANGLKVASGSVLELTLKGTSLWVIASASGTDLRTLVVG